MILQILLYSKYSKIIMNFLYLLYSNNSKIITRERTIGIFRFISVVAGSFLSQYVAKMTHIGVILHTNQLKGVISSNN